MRFTRQARFARKTGIRFSQIRSKRLKDGPCAPNMGA
jgi:hypothetical protein